MFNPLTLQVHSPGLHEKNFSCENCFSFTEWDINNIEVYLALYIDGQAATPSILYTAVDIVVTMYVLSL